MYAANRVTQGAVDSVARRATWGGIAAVMLLFGVIFAVIVAFWLLQDRYGATAAGVIMAAACFVLALIFLSVPQIIERFERQVQQASEADPLAEGAKVVEEEMHEVVDYFGPLRVVGSAFLLGLGVARTIRGT